MSKIVINPLDLRSCYSGIIKPFSIFVTVNGKTYLKAYPLIGH